MLDPMPESLSSDGCQDDPIVLDKAHDKNIFTSDDKKRKADNKKPVDVDVCIPNARNLDDTHGPPILVVFVPSHPSGPIGACLDDPDVPLVQAPKRQTCPLDNVYGGSHAGIPIHTDGFQDDSVVHTVVPVPDADAVDDAVDDDQQKLKAVDNAFLPKAPPNASEFGGYRSP
jgi:hypothetical protein